MSKNHLTREERDEIKRAVRKLRGRPSPFKKGTEPDWERIASGVTYPAVAELNLLHDRVRRRFIVGVLEASGRSKLWARLALIAIQVGCVARQEAKRGERCAVAMARAREKYSADRLPADVLDRLEPFFRHGWSEVLDWLEQFFRYGWEAAEWKSDAYERAAGVIVKLGPQGKQRWGKEYDREQKARRRAKDTLRKGGFTTDC